MSGNTEMVRQRAMARTRPKRAISSGVYHISSSIVVCMVSRLGGRESEQAEGLFRRVSSRRCCSGAGNALVESVSVFDAVVSTRSELLSPLGSEKQKVQYLEWPLRWSWVVWS